MVTPVPLSATVIPALVSFKVAVLEPAAAGVKVTLTVQESPAAKVEPQVVVREKSPWLVPVNEKFTLTVDPVPFMSVVFWLALELPTFWLPKLRLVGLNVTEPPPVVLNPAKSAP